MSSRAASAASSRRVKQELVRLLFGKGSSSVKSSSSSVATPLCRSQRLDHSIYSYSDLRTAYLERLQTLHPDKDYSNQIKNNAPKRRDHEEFVQLQEAWDRYDKMAKLATRVGGDDSNKDRNFTMFGVGCSFSDNEWERELRNEITDQACRGWFSSGSLTTGSSGSSEKGGSVDGIRKSSQGISLLDEDDDMFVSVSASEEDASDNPQQQQQQQKQPEMDAQPRRSLLDVKFRPRSLGG